MLIRFFKIDTILSGDSYGEPFSGMDTIRYQTLFRSIGFNCDSLRFQKYDFRKYIPKDKMFPLFLSNRIIFYRRPIQISLTWFQFLFSPTCPIFVHEYGLSSIGNSIYTSEKMIAMNPQIVESFLIASTKGWNYAIQSIDESIG